MNETILIAFTVGHSSVYNRRGGIRSNSNVEVRLAVIFSAGCRNMPEMRMRKEKSSISPQRGRQIKKHQKRPLRSCGIFSRKN